MTTRKFGRTALIAVLALSIIMSITGGTIAWFTDEVTSAGNEIKAGNLDVKLTVYNEENKTWEEVTDGSAPLFSYDKWEPGYTAYRQVKIENAGTLALKFQLNIKADSAVTGEYKLADVIDVYTSNDLPTRAALGTKVGTLTQMMDDADGAAYGVLKAGESTPAMYITLKMQETAGNEYQGLSVGSGFSLQLLATQDTVESDSFGTDYDKDATYSVDVWSGAIPEEKPDTLLVDEATKTITVTSAEELLYLNELAKESYTAAWDWTVKLTANIDLANRPINKIDISKWGIFDGNGHTISNVVMNDGQTGLFTSPNDDSGKTCIFKNLTVDGITVYAPNEENVGGVFGSTNAKVNKVIVKNANVTGKKYVGALAGKAGSVVDCKAINCVVSIPTDGEKTVGGLVGYIIVDGKSTDETRYIENNLVENVTVSGPYNVGGMFGQAQGYSDPMVVQNNTVKNVNVYYYKSEGYSAPEVGGAQVAARIVGDAEVVNNIIENVNVKTMKMISTAAELFAFAKDVNENNNAYGNAYVVLTADIDLENKVWTPIGQTGATTFNGIFDGQGYTISNLYVDSSAQTGAHYSSGLFGWVESHSAGHGHIKNVKIDGATVIGHHNCGALVGYITQETALVENCHVTNAKITCTNANSDANGDKAGALIGNATVATPVKNCSASNSTVSSGRDAGQVIGAGKEANVTDCSATNVKVEANGTGTGDNIRNEVIGRLL